MSTPSKGILVWERRSSENKSDLGHIRCPSNSTPTLSSSHLPKATEHVATLSLSPDRTSRTSSMPMPFAAALIATVKNAFPTAETMEFTSGTDTRINKQPKADREAQRLLRPNSGHKPPSRIRAAPKHLRKISYCTSNTWSPLDMVYSAGLNQANRLLQHLAKPWKALESLTVKSMAWKDRSSTVLGFILVNINRFPSSPFTSNYCTHCLLCIHDSTGSCYGHKPRRATGTSRPSSQTPPTPTGNGSRSGFEPRWPRRTLETAMYIHCSVCLTL